jgi:hypothetical protein
LIFIWQDLELAKVILQAKPQPCAVDVSTTLVGLMASKSKQPHLAE